MQLNKEKINKLYLQLNDKMKTEGIYGTLLVAGGAVMATVYNNRESTRDIDAIFEPKPAFKKIIHEIAENEGLEDNWLNDGVKGFIDTSKIEQTPFLSLSNLTINVLSDESMLALKLTSARLDSQDMADALTLMDVIKPDTIDDVFNIVESKSCVNQLSPLANFFIQEVFSQYETKKQNLAEAEGVMSPNQLKEYARQKRAERRSEHSREKNQNVTHSKPKPRTAR